MTQPMVAECAGASQRVPRQGPRGSDTTVGYPCPAEIHRLGSQLVRNAWKTPSMTSLVEDSYGQIPKVEQKCRPSSLASKTAAVNSKRTSSVDSNKAIVAVTIDAPAAFSGIWYYSNNDQVQTMQQQEDGLAQDPKAASSTSGNMNDQMGGIERATDKLSMSRGKAEIGQFSSESNQRKVRISPAWNVNPGIIRIREWVPDFTPYKIQSSLAQVWVRVYSLLFEYWHNEVLMGIARAIGTPLKIDGNTVHGTVGHFARILVEIEMSMQPQNSVMIDRGDASFFVDLDFENLPPFCGACQVVGHVLSKCRKVKRTENKTVEGGGRVIFAKSTVNISNLDESQKKDEGSASSEKLKGQAVRSQVDLAEKTDLEMSNKFDILARIRCCLTLRKGYNDLLLVRLSCSLIPQSESQHSHPPRLLPDHVENKLDRALMSSSFRDCWDSVAATLLPRLSSDHSPLVVQCGTGGVSGPRPFCFLSMWSEHESFLEVVRCSWSKLEDSHSRIRKVMNKLKRLKSFLKSWNFNSFGEVHKDLKAWQEELGEVQDHIAKNGYSNELMEHEIDIQVKVTEKLAAQSRLY
ncbi:hypothetical protein C2S51_029835 [Perilla frutescens var. frutescens]|nr:hypothetical protein C2S51_029835 [Perilla frutescens var. frutescens]